MSEFPEIDVTKIDFPSDGLTVGAIRKRFPESVDMREKDPWRFDRPLPFEAPVDELLHVMLHIERDLAKAVFGLTFGSETDIDCVDGDIKLLADDLSRYYMQFGIASGPHHATQLIRSIKYQALAQARQHFPPLA